MELLECADATEYDIWWGSTLSDTHHCLPYSFYLLDPSLGNQMVVVVGFWYSLQPIQ